MLVLEYISVKNHLLNTTFKFMLNTIFFFFRFRDNFLVLDIFFEALNYETIEQKKAYDVAGLLGGCYGKYSAQKAQKCRSVIQILTL